MPVTNSDKTKDSKIELRSEKVRQLIGPIPQSLTRCGFAIIAAVFFALIAAVCVIPYPYSNGESILGHILSNLL